MGALSGVARLLLVVVNLLFLLIGLALTIFGFILRFAKSLYEKVLDEGLDSLGKALEDTDLGDFDPKDIDLAGIVEGVAIGLIVGGIILIAITVLGCCGACCKVECMLWLYAIITIVCLIGEIIVIALLYGKPAIIKDNLKDTLEKYKGLAGSDATSVGWNVVMIHFDCCGVDNYEDFDVATGWNKTLAGTAAPPLVTPLACCKDLPTSPAAYSCATPYSAASNNGQTGCYATIWDKSFGNDAIAIPVLVICGIIQIAFIIFAFIIIKSSKHSISPI